MRLIDTHAHLCDQSFATDIASVLQRAAAAGVAAIIALGEDLKDARRNLELAALYPQLKPAAGLYPTHLDREAADDLETFIRQNRSRLHAIGEVGLDFWAVKEERQRALQREIFTRFIRLALEHAFRTFFTNTPRGGSQPSNTIDIFGVAEDGPNLRYARIRLAP